jgi:fatty acid desaturase
MLCTQSVALVGAHAGMLALAVALHGWRLGLYTYGLAFGLPALLAPSFMQFTNYIQHVHCDPVSADNHSRNFVSPLVNWFVFDAGYHAVHHERPSAHWTGYAALHRARAERIHPSLNKHSVLSFCLENYVLGALSARFRTRPLAADTERPRDAQPPQSLFRSSSKSGGGGRLLANSAMDGGASATGGSRSAKAMP